MNEIPSRTITIYVLKLTFVLFFQTSSFSLVEAATVNIKIDSDTRIGIPHKLRIKYTLIESHERAIKMPFKIDPILQGAGLVLTHIAEDGTKTVQKKTKRNSWFADSPPDNILYIDLNSTIYSREVSPLSFDIWVSFVYMCKNLGPSGVFDFSEPGVYQISYEHPWASPNDNPNKIGYTSSKLTVIPVNSKRNDELHSLFHNKPELELASYRFRHPPLKEPPVYHPSLTPILKDAINNAQPDVVLFLLGSPDFISTFKKDDRHILQWYYIDGPVGGFLINFHDGKVVSVSSTASSS